METYHQIPSWRLGKDYLIAFLWCYLAAVYVDAQHLFKAKMFL
jgi:hypothetical protein